MSPHNKICRLSVLIPVYNEEKTFRTMLEGIQRIRPSNLRKEYIVVDDGSTDGTLEAVRNTPCPGLRVFRHERRLGRGAAIRTAIRHARGDFIVFQDADLEYDPQAHVSVMEPLLDGRADAVFGSRFLRKGNTFLAWSYVGNKFLTHSANLVLGVAMSDMETGVKAFRGDLLRSLPLVSDGFELDPELTVMLFKRNARVEEVPITYHARSIAEGRKIRWYHGFRTLWALISCRMATG